MRQFQPGRRAKFIVLLTRARRLPSGRVPPPTDRRPPTHPLSTTVSLQWILVRPESRSPAPWCDPRKSTHRRRPGNTGRRPEMSSRVDIAVVACQNRITLQEFVRSPIIIFVLPTPDDAVPVSVGPRLLGADFSYSSHVGGTYLDKRCLYLTLSVLFCMYCKVHNECMH